MCDPFRARPQPRWTAEELDGALARLVGRRVRAARLAEGDRQSDVADATGLCLRELVRIEGGAVDVRTGSLARIAATLHVELSSLIPSSSEVVEECRAARKAKRHA